MTHWNEQRHKGSFIYRFCSRETLYGRSSGDPLPLEMSRTFFDSAEAPETLFILQA